MRFYRLCSALLIVTISTVLCTSVLATKTPVNLSTIKKEVIAYYDSGQYEKQISARIKNGICYLRFRLNQNKQLRQPHKLAVVFDIDETILSNYKNMLSHDFGGTRKEIQANESAAKDSVIPPSYALYNYAIRHHVAVFFITGRGEDERTPTTANLRAVNIKTWKALYMKPDSYHNKSIIPFKRSCRRHIENQGYDIVLNVGDQMSDLKGGYSDMVVKLPNPYYFIS